MGPHCVAVAAKITPEAALEVVRLVRRAESEDNSWTDSPPFQTLLDPSRIRHRTSGPEYLAYLHSRSRFFRIRPRRTSRIRCEPDPKRPLMVSVFSLSSQDT